MLQHTRPHPSPASHPQPPTPPTHLHVACVGRGAVEDFGRPHAAPHHLRAVSILCGQRGRGEQRRSSWPHDYAAAYRRAETQLPSRSQPCQATRTQVGQAWALQQAPLLGRHPRLLQQRRQPGSHVCEGQDQAGRGWVGRYMAARCIPATLSQQAPKERTRRNPEVPQPRRLGPLLQLLLQRVDGPARVARGVRVQRRLCRRGRAQGWGLRAGAGRRWMRAPGAEQARWSLGEC